MKKRILLSSLLVLSIVGCTNPILNNTSQYSDLDKEYSQFKTEALTQSYLKKKMDKWLSDSKYSKNLVREIEYAKFKHKDLLKDIVALQPTMFNSITGNTGVTQKRAEPSFENYIEYINPFPSNVTATSATNITSSSFTANWNAVTNATGYKLYIDGNATPITLANVTTYNVTGLVDASSHSYYVKATNSAGESSVSNTINLTLPSALPIAPTANSASAITSTSFTANWGAVTGATGYKLYIDGTPITLGLVTNYNATGLTDGSSHSYYVKTINSAGDSPVSNTINLTLPSALPSAPTALNATGKTSSSFTANWNAVTGATGYKLFIDDIEIDLGLVTTYTKTGFTGGTSHNYYIKAINAGGNSASSNTINLTLLSGAPTATSATSITETQFTANWTAFIGATGYKIYLDGSATPVTLGNVLTYNVTGLTKGTAHSYYIKAILNTGDSPSSNTINLYTVYEEFKVNSYTTSGQYYPSLGMDDAGKFVVTWSGAGNGDDAGIYAQKYNADGSPNGSQFLVNSFTANTQNNPSIGMANDGSFVISWNSYGEDGDSTSYTNVYAQKYNADGTTNGSEFRVNTFTTNSQIFPSIAMNKSTGSFIITWGSTTQEGESAGNYNVYAQKYNSDGSVNGSEFRVNTYTAGTQQNPAIAMASNGKFIISWQGNGTGDYDGIFAQKYNTDGSKNGSEFKVNTFTTNSQRYSSIGMVDDGRFVISWESMGQDGDDTYWSYYNIYAQKYNSDGSVNGSEFRVNTYTTDSQLNSSITMTSDGRFVISWDSHRQDGDDTNNSNIYAQRYNADGTTNGNQFKVNSYTTNSQQYPSVGLDSTGNFVITWQGQGNGDSLGIFAKRFDTNGNVL